MLQIPAEYKIIILDTGCKQGAGDHSHMLVREKTLGEGGVVHAVLTK